jgi:hypothetical protein
MKTNREISCTGNIPRFYGQKRACLIAVTSKPVVQLSKALREHTGYSEKFKGRCILLTFQGDQGVPFVEVRPYTTARLLSLEKHLNSEFLVGWPQKPAEEEMSFIEAAQTGAAV